MPGAADAGHRAVRRVHKAGGFDDSSFCQHDGRTHGGHRIHPAHLHLWSLRPCHRFTHSSVLAGILAVHARARHTRELHSGLRVHNPFHHVHLNGTRSSPWERTGATSRKKVNFTHIFHSKQNKIFNNTFKTL